MDEFVWMVGISWPQAAAVVVASCVLYLVYAATLALWGQRRSVGTSTLGIAVATLTGSLMARAMLGNAPTMTGGLLAVGTIVVLEVGLGSLRNRGLVAHRRHPVRVVLVDGRVLHDQLRLAHVAERDLAVGLRQHGVRRYEDLALVLIEARGTLTTVPAGETIAAALVRDVHGIENVPGHIVAR